jgi:hypothetical protein
MPMSKEDYTTDVEWRVTFAFDPKRKSCAVVTAAFFWDFPRWRFNAADGPAMLPIEFNHYEGAVAHTLGLPLLLLVQAGVLRRVVFNSSYKGFVGIVPAKPTPKWLRTEGGF